MAGRKKTEPKPPSIARGYGYVLTEEEKKIVIDGARRGLSWSTCAGLIGMPRTTLDDKRRADPELDAAMAKALAQWDSEMQEREAAFLAKGNAVAATHVADIRRKRLPQLYSPDLRMRRGPQDVRIGDQDDSPPTVDDVILQGVEALIAIRKSGEST